MTDKLFRYLCLASAAVVPLLFFCILARLILSSWDAWNAFGLRFLISSDWDPTAGKYGALPALTGTLLTTAIAVGVAVPLGFVTAFYLSNLPRWIARPLSSGLDLLAAIPSVIYGMWGLFVFVPIMQNHIQPFLARTLGLGRIPFVGESFNGFGILTAGLVLALMILPFVSATMRDVFATTPSLLKEAAIGIGCTRWETARDIVLRYGIRGAIGGIFIGLGRALGETMAVLFIIGNVVKMPRGIFDVGTTVAATLANNFAEADGTTKSVLFALGLVLLGLSFFVQIAAQFYLNRTRARRGEI